MSDPVSRLDLFVVSATGVSALATTAAAIIIGVQSRYTRRAVEVAERGTALSHAMAAETMKMRLDARAPQLTVETRGDVEWSPLEPALADHRPTSPERLYYLPRDRSEPILVRMPIRISNHSGTSVRIDISKGVVPDDWTAGTHKPDEWELPAGCAGDFFVQEVRSVNDWVDSQHHLGSVGPDDPIVGHVRHSDPHDDGVVDSWEIHLIGTPLVHDPDRDGAWKLADRATVSSGHPAMAGEVRPMRRDYYLSKVADEKLV